MGNTVGSTNIDFCKNLDSKVAYAIGLWCADGYVRTSSIGISNTDEGLVDRFRDFLASWFSSDRFRLKIFIPVNPADQNRTRQNFGLEERQISTYVSPKARTVAYHLYVNCRSLARFMVGIKSNICEVMGTEFSGPYFAGRFDGDGSVSQDFRSDCRIVYASLAEAERDANFLKSSGFIKIKIYRYKAAHTFCLYISRFEANGFLSKIYPYSLRLQKSMFVPRRDLVSQ